MYTNMSAFFINGKILYTAFNTSGMLSPALPEHEYFPDYAVDMSACLSISGVS